MPDPVVVRRRTYEWSDPQLGADAMAEMDGVSLLTAMRDGSIPAPPISTTMGLCLERVDPSGVVFTLDLREWHYNQTGCGHGSVHAALLDSAMGCAVQATLPAGCSYTTVDLAIKYLRPARLSNGSLVCRGTVVSAGHRIVTAEGRIRDQSGQLIATGVTTCLVMRSAKH